MKKCKVIGCNNSESFMSESGKHKTLKGCFGYCQIHFLEGLVKEIGCGEELKIRNENNWMCGHNGNLCKECSPTKTQEKSE